jgi:hypothetical protein
VQDSCYELLFRVAAFGLDKKSASVFIDELAKNGILEGSIDWPHTFLPSHRREHKRMIPNATTVKWTCSHLIKHLHLLKIIVHSLGQLGMMHVRLPWLLHAVCSFFSIYIYLFVIFTACSGKRDFAKVV